MLKILIKFTYLDYNSLETTGWAFFNDFSISFIELVFKLGWNKF